MSPRWWRENTLRAKAACPGKRLLISLRYFFFFVDIRRFIIIVILIILNQSSLNFISLRHWRNSSSHFQLGSAALAETNVSSYMFNEELCCFIKFLLCPRRNFMHNWSEFIWMFWSVRPEIFPNCFFFFFFSESLVLHSLWCIQWEKKNSFVFAARRSIRGAMRSESGVGLRALWKL